MSEWDHRQLCSDGGCVGVIGADGVCKACGRAAPNWGDERKRGMVEASSDDDDEDAEDAEETGAESDEDDDDDEDDEDEEETGAESDEDGEDDDDDDDGEDAEDDDDDDDDDDDSDDDSEAGVITAKDGGGEWGKRELCPDGGCVGVVGDKGVCNVCGKSAA